MEDVFVMTWTEGGGGGGGGDYLSSSFLAFASKRSTLESTLT